MKDSFILIIVSSSAKRIENKMILEKVILDTFRLHRNTRIDTFSYFSAFFTTILEM